MLPTLLAALAGLLYVGAIYWSRLPEIKRRDRDDPRVIAHRVKRILAVCLVWLVVVPLTAPMLVASLVRLMGFIPGFTNNYSLAADVIGLLKAIRTIGALYLGTMFAYFYQLKLDVAAFIDDVYINFFTFQGYRDHIFAPLTEEFVYRSVVLTYLAKLLPVVVYASPLLFGLAHLHHAWEVRRHHPKMPWTIVWAQAAFQLVYTTVFGMLLTYFFRKYHDNVWTCVALHFLCNLLQFPPASVDGPLYANIIYYVLLVWGIARFVVLLRSA